MRTSSRDHERTPPDMPGSNSPEATWEWQKTASRTPGKIFGTLDDGVTSHGICSINSRCAMPWTRLKSLYLHLPRGPPMHERRPTLENTTPFPKSIIAKAIKAWCGPRSGPAPASYPCCSSEDVAMENSPLRAQTGRHDHGATGASSPSATAIRGPLDVLRHDGLTFEDKRAVLASCASDACAVEAAPALRRIPVTGQVVQIDDIFDALKALDLHAVQRSPEERGLSAALGSRPPEHLGHRCSVGRDLASATVGS